MASSAARMSLNEKVQKTRRARQWARAGGESPAGNSGGESVSTADTYPSSTHALTTETTPTSSGTNHSSSNGNSSTSTSRMAEVAQSHKDRYRAATSKSSSSSSSTPPVNRPPQGESLLERRRRSRPKSPAVPTPQSTTTMPAPGSVKSRSSLFESQRTSTPTAAAAAAQTEKTSSTKNRASLFEKAAEQKRNRGHSPVVATTSATTSISRQMEAAEKAMSSSVKSRSSLFEKAADQKRQQTNTFNTTAPPPKAADQKQTSRGGSSVSEKAQQKRQAHRSATTSKASPQLADPPGRGAADPPPQSSSVKSRSSLFEKAEQKRSIPVAKPTATTTPVSASSPAAPEQAVSVKNRSNLFEKPNHRRQSATPRSSTTQPSPNTLRPFSVTSPPVPANSTPRYNNNNNNNNNNNGSSTRKKENAATTKEESPKPLVHRKTQKPYIPQSSSTPWDERPHDTQENNNNDDEEENIGSAQKFAALKASFQNKAPSPSPAAPRPALTSSLTPSSEPRKSAAPSWVKEPTTTTESSQDTTETAGAPDSSNSTRKRNVWPPTGSPAAVYSNAPQQKDRELSHRPSWIKDDEKKTEESVKPKLAGEEEKGEEKDGVASWMKNRKPPAVQEPRKQPQQPKNSPYRTTRPPPWVKSLEPEDKEEVKEQLTKTESPPSSSSPWITRQPTDEVDEEDVHMPRSSVVSAWQARQTSSNAPIAENNKNTMKSTLWEKEQETQQKMVQPADGPDDEEESWAAEFTNDQSWNHMENNAFRSEESIVNALKEAREALAEEHTPYTKREVPAEEDVEAFNVTKQKEEDLVQFLSPTDDNIEKHVQAMSATKTPERRIQNPLDSMYSPPLKLDNHFDNNKEELMSEAPSDAVSDTPSKSLFQMAADSVLVVDYNQLVAQEKSIHLSETGDEESIMSSPSSSIGHPSTPSVLPKEIQDLLDGKKSVNKASPERKRLFNFDHIDDESQQDEAVLPSSAMAPVMTSHASGNMERSNLSRPGTVAAGTEKISQASATRPVPRLPPSKKDATGYPSRPRGSPRATASSAAVGVITTPPRSPEKQSISSPVSESGSSIVFGVPTTFGTAGSQEEDLMPPPVSERAKAIEEWRGGRRDQQELDIPPPPPLGSFPSANDTYLQTRVVHSGEGSNPASGTTGPQRKQTPEKGILRDSTVRNAEPRRSVRFSDPPAALTASEWDEGNADESYEDTDNFYRSISPKESKRRETNRVDHPIDEYHSSVSPEIEEMTSEDASDILKYWATSEDSKNFNDADEWMDQDPDLDDPAFQEDSPSPETIEDEYGDSGALSSGLRNLSVRDGSVDPTLLALNAITSPMGKNHSLHPSEQQLFDPFGNFTDESVEAIAPIDFAPISTQTTNEAHQSSTGRSSRGVPIKIAPPGRDSRKPRKLAPSTRDQPRIDEQEFAHNGDWDWDAPTDLLEI